MHDWAETSITVVGSRAVHGQTDIHSEIAEVDALRVESAVWEEPEQASFGDSE